MFLQHPACLFRFLLSLLCQWHVRPSYVSVVSVPRGLAVTQQDEAVGPGGFREEQREGGREEGREGERGREDEDVRRDLV